jgi:hypothetical protein
MASPQRTTGKTLRRLKGLVILDGAAPDVEITIGEHMFNGIAFAVDYERIPDPARTALQDQHVLLMRSMQDLMRQRHAGRLH